MAAAPTYALHSTELSRRTAAQRHCDRSPARSGTTLTSGMTTRPRGCASRDAATRVAPAERVHFLLDSTVLIDYLRDRPVVARVHELVDRGDVVATSAVNVEEIIRGTRPAESDVVDRLVSGVVVLAVDQTAARLSGRWRAEYAARGITLHQADCLVAGTAMAHGARLCTGNPKDFPMLDVEHWPVGR